MRSVLRTAMPPLVAAGIWLALLLRGQSVGLWWLPAIAVALLVSFGPLSPSGKTQALAVIGLAVVRGLGFGINLPQNPTLAALGQSLRAIVRNNLAGVTQNAAALALGITDGDSSLLPKNLTSELNSLSLSHLTAVSGTNCSILLASLMLLAGYLGLRRSGRLILGLTGLAAYLVLVGDQPSVIRAAVMGLVVVVAFGAGLKFKGINLLSLAVVMLLIINPSYSMNLGFGLSVAATAGVLLLAPALSLKLAWLPRWLALSVAVAASAQFACLPLLAGIQGGFNLGGLIANLLAEPVVTPITLLGLLGATLAILGAPFGVTLGPPAMWLATLPSQFILVQSHFLASTFPAVALPSGVAGPALATLILLAVIWWAQPRLPGRWIAFVALGLVLIMFATQLAGKAGRGVFPGENWVMVACDVGQGDATVLRSGSQIAVIDVGRDPQPIDRCLRRLEISRIALLVLTHFDLDHVEGLAGALEGRVVTRAITTQFVDERPGAKDCERLLRREGIPLRKVSLGDAGALGGIGRPDRLDWLVLTPHAGGEGSISSNDGSVAMFWHRPGLNIFTMADLPATGQQRIMEEKQMWWRPEYGSVPSILKLSHHGSADQDPEFLAWVHPAIATISVGVGNSYGHPTAKALNWLASDALLTLRTDQLGSLAIDANPGGHSGSLQLAWASSGAG